MQAINSFLHNKKSKQNQITALKDPSLDGHLTNESFRLPHIFNSFFATVGENYANNIALYRIYLSLQSQHQK